MEATSKSQEEIDFAEEKKNLKKIEAALFLSARYLSVQELVELTDINPLLLRELLDKLKQNYLERDSAIELLNKDELWKMDIKQEYFEMINKFFTGSSEFSKAEQETLAIIAYKQPVKQSVIIKIRGNKAYEHVRHFIDIGLVKAKKAGHTQDLSLSESFYDYFHVEKKPAKTKTEEELEEREEIVEEKKGEEQLNSQEISSDK
ncbi:SMC-Scp complex subunit ScpB [Candidatus Pacearchaeota archaeon]|nr:SMC-Scp complex subunit ScpB [Candidatus Pacearchaeota archaeon]